MQPVNRLANALSPYLLQHADNPVHWYEWGEEAFAEAERRQLPIFLSIGYSSCYWCHVMAHDSFESPEVAELLNRDFISIKLDREERPDVDQLYMDFVVALTGQGGWPMSVFLTPQRKPFWGGTFFPRPQFVRILSALAEAWRNERERVLTSADEILQAVHYPRVAERDIPPDAHSQAMQELEQSFDGEYGGFGEAPKFPPTAAISLLLAETEPLRREMAALTLRRMGQGGIYDHVGGGFSRYSVDRFWRVPHFEKMLYDNALLTSAYLEGWLACGDRGFGEIARRTLAFTERELRCESGGYYSALDAGEVEHEGEYYVWKYEELKSIIPEPRWERFAEIFAVSPQGNFEHGSNVLTLRDSHDLEVLTESDYREFCEMLEQSRSHRQRPARDDKRLSSWNALLLTALCRAYQLFGETHYRNSAEELGRWLFQDMISEGALLHRAYGSERGIPGFLDDYAYAIEAALALLSSTGDAGWLRCAIDLQTGQDSRFFLTDEGRYRYSAAPELIADRTEQADGATPSPIGTTALNLMKLYTVSGDPHYRERAEVALRSLNRYLSRAPSACCKALQAERWLRAGAISCVVTGGRGPLAAEAERRMYRLFPPRGVYLFVRPGEELPALQKLQVQQNGTPTVYLCREGVCAAPISEPGQIDQALSTLGYCSQPFVEGVP